MEYSLYLLDADGTLFDYDRAEHCALRGACEQFSVPYGETTERLYAAINNRYWKLYEQGKVDARGLQVGRFHELFDELHAAEAEPESFNECYLTLLSRGSYLLPGAAELCRRLHARGKTLAIVTNGMSRTQKGRFEGSEIVPYITKMIVSEDAGCAKPDPRYFGFTLFSLGHVRRDDVLVVGDSLTADIAGGEAAGLDTCWVNYGGLENGSGVRPTYEIHTLDELPGIAKQP